MCPSPRHPPWPCPPYPKSQATPGSVPERCRVPRGAGTGGLGLAIEGPSEAKMSCKDNKDGSCTVEYIPFTPGDYDVNITFGGHPIPGTWWGWGLGGGRGELGGCSTHQGGCGSDMASWVLPGGCVCADPVPKPMVTPWLCWPHSWAGLVAILTLRP